MGCAEPMADDPILNASLHYGEARRLQLLLRRKMAPLGCQWQDDETAACYHVPESEQCPNCTAKAPIYAEFRIAHKAEKDALRRLQKLLARAQEGR